MLAWGGSCRRISASPVWQGDKVLLGKMTRTKAVPVYPGFPEKLGRDSSSLEQPDLRHISRILSVSGGSIGKESACNMGDAGYIPGSGRSPGEGNANPLQCSCWRIPWAEEPGGLQSAEPQSWTWVSNFHSLPSVRLSVTSSLCLHIVSTVMLPEQCLWDFGALSRAMAGKVKFREMIWKGNRICHLKMYLFGIRITK